MHILSVHEALHNVCNLFQHNLVCGCGDNSAITYYRIWSQDNTGNRHYLNISSL